MGLKGYYNYIGVQEYYSDIAVVEEFRSTGQ